jgi:hypothetical protein
VGYGGRPGCGGCLRPGLAAEGDFVAHVAQGPDEAADLPHVLALGLVVAGAEVRVPGSGIGQQGVEDA